MTVAPWRYPHIFTLWQNWLKEGRKHQLDNWLSDRFKGEKRFGKRDRQAYRDALFGAMRFLELACLLEQDYQGARGAITVDEIEPAAFWYWTLLRLHGDAIPPRELDDSEARLVHFNACERVWKNIHDTPEHALAWWGLPPEQWPNLQQRAALSGWDDTTLERFVQMTTEPTVVWLRPQNIGARACLNMLSDDGIEATLCEETRLLFCPGNAKIQQSQCYNDGFIEIQDAASVALARQIQAAPGDTIWDMCAGAGGKSLAIANQHPANAVFATDIRSSALKKLQERQRRAQLDNITTQTHDGSQALSPATRFDWVIVDAPCSGAGVWRRSPDSKHRLSASDELHALQYRLLENAAAHTAAGGHLVYATCSWLHSENEAQVERFISEHPEFKRVKQQLHGYPQSNADAMWSATLQHQQDAATY